MMRIYLVGLPSCGKTTLGRIASGRLGLRMMDMDELIEKREEMTIPEIFAQKGEDYFRKVEAEVLRDLAEEEDVIISTGGGAPCFHGNMDFIKENGRSVYVKVSVEEIVRRLVEAKGTAHRPLLKDKTAEDLADELNAKLNERELFYAQSDIVLRGDSLSADDLVRAIKS